MNEYTLWALKILSALGVTLLLSSVWYLDTVMVITLTAFSSNLFNLSFDFIFDLESLLFFLSISWISVAVFSYSLEYMKAETSKDRFFLLLFSFVLSMWILVFSGNYFILLVGWDGLGVTSFLLVIFFQNKNSLNAGLITLLTNRIGDVLIMMSLLIFISVGGVSIWAWSMGGGGLPALATVLVVCAAFTKSAQIPFSSWLPAAMAAPTPVSSLVHSSTLVTAGIYMLLRFKDHLSSAWPHSTEFMLITGAATMVMAGLGGLLEDDFKKMVALSTLSQLGLMVCCLGLSCYQVAFFHLLIHAYFKALMFMATGATIHASGDYQDLRVISIPFQQSKHTSSILTVSNLSLMGLPFMSGFYSKDMMLEISLSSNMGTWGGYLFICGTSLTVLYALRFLSLSGGSSALSSPLQNSKDSEWKMFSSYDMLFILAIAGGSMLNYMYMVFPPTLILSPEIKNSVFILIVSSWCLHSSGMLKISSSFTKRTLGLMLGLTLLSPGVMKQIISVYALFNDKTVEKFFINQLLVGGSDLPTQSVASTRNMMVFFCGFVILFVIILIFFLGIELFNPSFGLGSGFAPSMSEI